MTDELVLRYAAMISKLEKRIRDLEKGARSPQLGNASLDLDSSRGYIPIRQNGQERARIGRQPDGTVTFTSVNSPNAPNQPVPIQVEPLLGGVRVTVYGILGEQPHDFSHCKIYCDGLEAGTITSLPGTLYVGPLSYTSHGFYATAVNLSGKESEQTDFVFATPAKAVADDITNSIIDALKIADEAITRAKIAVGAVGTAQLGDRAVDLEKLADGSVDARTLIDGAVTEGKIAAAAVVAEAIAANAVIAGKIAAEAVTATEIAALTIQAGNIAADAIAAGKIAAEAITAREIAALAITAEKLAANSVTAAAIATGSISAEKLAAELILTSRIVVGGLEDWHLEINSSNSPLMYWNSQDIGFALTRDETTNKANVYVSGRMEFGNGSQIDSDIIDLQELPSTGWQDPRVRQSRHWMQSQVTTSINPYYISPTMKHTMVLMSVYQVTSGAVPSCSTPINSQIVQSYVNANTRLTTFLIEDTPGSRTFEYFESSTPTMWGITLTEFQGTMLPDSLDVFNHNEVALSNSMSTNTINPTAPNTLQVAIFGADRGPSERDNFGSAINGFAKQTAGGSAHGFGTAMYTKKATTTDPSSTTVNHPSARWSAQIIAFKLAPASTIPPAPTTDRTIRWYTRRVQGIAAPHVIQEDGYTYPVTRGPYCKVIHPPDYALPALVDIYAQSSWEAVDDPYSMVAISTEPGAFSSVTIPITGLYMLEMHTIFMSSTNTTDAIVHFMTQNARDVNQSILRGTTKYVNAPADGSRLNTVRTIRLTAGTVIYWGHFSAVNSNVWGTRLNTNTEIGVTYLGPGA